ncbi:unnamed protein product [Linum trigynum]|uniref:Uncharacterized protein n=1 Tax=Linum trigynum TaxID=586398 RepID=A0AAV2CZK8_9ROSI
MELSICRYGKRKPYITNLYLRWHDFLDDLCSPHVLAKLDVEVGPRKPVSGLGGVMISPESHVSGRLVDALADVVVSVIKRESSSTRKQTATL